MIFKRKHQPMLAKKGKEPKKLRQRNFIYELVEDTMIKKKEDMEVILTAFVEGLGDRGEIVKVRPNFAYRQLLVPGLAVYKNEENLQTYKRDETKKDEVKHSSPFAKRTVDILEFRRYAIVMNKFKPWTIEKWHIRASLRKAGIIVLSDDCIELPSEPITGPDPAKQNKEFIVTVTINNMEKAKVRCRIHHWSNNPSTREPYVFEHWKQPAEPLFPKTNEA